MDVERTTGGSARNAHGLHVQLMNRIPNEALWRLIFFREREHVRTTKVTMHTTGRRGDERSQGQLLEHAPCGKSSRFCRKFAVSFLFLGIFIGTVFQDLRPNMGGGGAAPVGAAPIIS